VRGTCGSALCLCLQRDKKEPKDCEFPCSRARGHIASETSRDNARDRASNAIQETVGLVVVHDEEIQIVALARARSRMRALRRREYADTGEIARCFGLSDPHSWSRAMDVLGALGKLVPKKTVGKIYDDALSGPLRQIGKLGTDVVKTARLLLAPLQYAAAAT
jgi:hypothetical protein